MEENKQIKATLPENAYRELREGEQYEPLMSAQSKPKEVTPYSVGMGLLMAIIFSAAAAYLGLKVGQVFEAAIPIAIIAVGVGTLTKQKNMLGQNVIKPILVRWLELARLFQTLWKNLTSLARTSLHHTA